MSQNVMELNVDVQISKVDHKEFLCLQLLELILFSKNNFYNLGYVFVVESPPASTLVQTSQK